MPIRKVSSGDGFTVPGWQNQVGSVIAGRRDGIDVATYQVEASVSLLPVRDATAVRRLRSHGQDKAGKLMGYATEEQIRGFLPRVSEPERSKKGFIVNDGEVAGVFFLCTLQILPLVGKVRGSSAARFPTK